MSRNSVPLSRERRSWLRLVSKQVMARGELAQASVPLGSPSVVSQDLVEFQREVAGIFERSQRSAYF